LNDDVAGKRRSCFDKLSTNGKCLTILLRDPFALSLSKGGYTFFSPFQKGDLYYPFRHPLVAPDGARAIMLRCSRGSKQDSSWIASGSGYEVRWNAPNVRPC